MKYIVLVMTALALVGCQTTPKMPQIVYQQVPVLPPDALISCPDATGQKPNPDTATNQEIAEYISKLHRANKVCKANMNAISSFKNSVGTVK